MQSSQFEAGRQAAMAGGEIPWGENPHPKFIDGVLSVVMASSTGSEEDAGGIPLGSAVPIYGCSCCGGTRARCGNLSKLEGAAPFEDRHSYTPVAAVYVS